MSRETCRPASPLEDSSRKSVGRELVAEAMSRRPRQLLPFRFRHVAQTVRNVLANLQRPRGTSAKPWTGPRPKSGAAFGMRWHVWIARFVLSGLWVKGFEIRGWTRVDLPGLARQLRPVLSATVQGRRKNGDRLPPFWMPFAQVVLVQPFTR